MTTLLHCWVALLATVLYLRSSFEALLITKAVRKVLVPPVYQCDCSVKSKEH